MAQKSVSLHTITHVVYALPFILFNLRYRYMYTFLQKNCLIGPMIGECAKRTISKMSSRMFRTGECSKYTYTYTSFRFQL